MKSLHLAGKRVNYTQMYRMESSNKTMEMFSAENSLRQTQ